MPTIREIMTIEVKAAEPETSIEELAGMMRDEDVGAIPVLEDGTLLGIVTDRDIVVRCIAEGGDPAEMTAEDIISENVETIDPDSDVRDAARLMAERRIRRLPVVEEDRLIGMISLGDIAAKHGDERVSGAALEGISEGVKPSRSHGEKKPVPISQGRRDSALAGEGQGISHENAEREQQRQQRVNPPRAATKSRRRAS
jgi:CBS domain-containing protein